MQASILIVEDHSDVRAVIRQALEGKNYEVIEAEDGESGLSQFQSLLPDLAIIDVGLPGAYDGVELCKKIHATHPKHPVLIISGMASPERAVEAMKQGAFDYLGKPLNFEKLLLLVERGLASVMKDKELERVTHATKASYGFEQLIGSNSAMQDVIRTAKKVAEVPFATVLLTGDSGTGKELIAHAIHLSSPNAKEPFVEINCAAMPETLLEAELFGHEKGAFTDAKQRKRGLLETASAGTFFLDEIGEMPQNLQVKLLKVLEERSFRRLGGTVPISVQFRLIAATNADLTAMLAANRFRSDLFYRLNVFSIHLPPLRDRGRDIIELANHFIRHFNREFGRQIKGISSEAEHLMLSYDWPGNIRELRNAIERAVLIESNEYIMPSDLAIKSKGMTIGRDQPLIEAEITPEQNNFEIKVPSHGVDFEDVEKQLLRIAMRHCHNNASAAARFLRMTRETLRYRLKKHGIKEYAES